MELTHETPYCTVFPQSLSPPVSRLHILSTVFPCLPRYVHGFVATSMVSDEMDGVCSTNGLSKKCMKKLLSENQKWVVYLED